MSTEEDGISSAFISLDRLLKDVTSEAVATALVDFPLQLGIQRDFEWLAMATRRALATAHRDLSDGPDRISSSDVRSQLEKLAINTDKTWRELFGRDSAVDDHLWNYALRHWDGAGGTDVGDGNIVGEPPMMARFNAAVQELDVLASFLRDAAKEIETQRGPWRGSEQRRLRIERAQYLAPVFEAAFGEPVSANNYPSESTRPGPTPFMDFYQRMVALAFNEQATPDLSGVVKDACGRHRLNPAVFADGIIPGL